jgi:hypothetical protein
VGGIEEEEVQQDWVCQSIRGRVFGGLVELGWKEGVRRAQGDGHRCGKKKTVMMRRVDEEALERIQAYRYEAWRTIWWEEEEEQPGFCRFTGFDGTRSMRCLEYSECIDARLLGQLDGRKEAELCREPDDSIGWMRVWKDSKRTDMRALKTIWWEEEPVFLWRARWWYRVDSGLEEFKRTEQILEQNLMGRRGWK